MDDTLDYESGVDRAKELHAQRWAAWGKVFIAIGICIVAAVILGTILLCLASRPTMNHVTLRVVNNTASQVADAGFTDCYNTRVISVGLIPAHQFREVSVDYNENDCPIAFSFDQSGQTFYVPMDGQLVSDASTYTIALSGGIVTTVFGPAGGMSKTLVQTATTQPIKF